MVSTGTKGLQPLNPHFLEGPQIPGRISIRILGRLERVEDFEQEILRAQPRIIALKLLNMTASLVELKPVAVHDSRQVSCRNNEYFPVSDVFYLENTHGGRGLQIVLFQLFFVRLHVVEALRRNAGKLYDPLLALFDE